LPKPIMNGKRITGRDDVLKCNDVSGRGNVETQYFASL